MTKLYVLIAKGENSESKFMPAELFGEHNVTEGMLGGKEELHLYKNIPKHFNLNRHFLATVTIDDDKLATSRNIGLLDRDYGYSSMLSTHDARVKKGEYDPVSLTVETQVMHIPAKGKKPEEYKEMTLSDIQAQQKRDNQRKQGTVHRVTDALKSLTGQSHGQSHTRHGRGM